MRTSAPALAAGLTRTWVRLYTRGLPRDLRAARLTELESDLWEHEQWRTIEGRRSGQISLEIVTRLVAGLPADLSWRIEQRAPHRHTARLPGGGTMIELLKKYGMVALAVALAVWAITVVPILAGSPDPIQGALSVAFGLLILGGLVAMHRGLHGGRVAVAVGVLFTGFLVVWLVIPAIAAVAIVIWLLATRDLERVPPEPA